jgi:DNA replication protein DnaD
MKNKGWVKLWREQYDSWISKKPFCDGYAWSYLYSQANHKKGMVNFRNEYIEIERGQLLTSKLKLQEKFGWTRWHITSTLRALERREMITYRTTNRYIIITIVNYNKYQGSEEQDDEQNNIQNDNRTTTDDQQPSINKNKEKKKKYIKKKKNYFSEELPESNYIDLRKELDI